MPFITTAENFMKSWCIAALLALLAAVLVTVACDDGSGPGDTDGGPELTVADETCPSDCERNPECSADHVGSCCTCIMEPTVETERCTPDHCDEYSGTGPVDLGCFTTNPWEEELPEGTVRLTGVVDVYATGGDSTDGIHVEVYRMNDDATLGSRVGEFVTDDADAACGDHETALEPFLVETGDEAANCPGICTEEIPDTDGDCRDLGFYAIDGIPTHVPLIIVTYGGELWRYLYAYNLMFFDSEAQDMEIDGVTAPTIYHKVRVLSNGDFSAIPMTAGMPGGIPETHGAVAGEIHDCGDVRVRNVQVGIEPVPQRLIYFNGNESKPYPEGTRRVGTCWLGLFAGLDIDPEENPVRVSAAGLVNGELVSFGWVVARVYPGAVTIMTFRGTRPGIDVFDE
jgi:hypothetical protein